MSATGKEQNNDPMKTEPFAMGDSWLHDIDPRLRILFAAAYSIPVAISSDFTMQFAALGFSALLTVLARLEPAAVARRLAVVFGFLIFLWIVLPWTFEGEKVLQVGPFAATREGLELSARITLKSIAIVSALMALVATMSIASLGQALGGLGVPSKMVHLLLLTYRYLFVIEAEYQKLLRAARVRRFSPGTNIHTYKTYAYLIGMLFVRASFRAERVHQAMRCRGFKGKFYSLRDFPPDPKNRIFAALMTTAIVVLSSLEWGGF